MQPRDFCYWLQGYFELAGDGAEITPERALVIRAHLALVFAHVLNDKGTLDPGSLGRPTAFCHWLQGAFDLGGVTFTPERHATLKAKLDDVFVHAIDTQYAPAKRQALQAIHDGTTARAQPDTVPPGIQAMC